MPKYGIELAVRRIYRSVEAKNMDEAVKQAKLKALDELKLVCPSAGPWSITLIDIVEEK